MGLQMHLMTPGLYQESKYIYDPWVVLNVKYIWYDFRIDYLLFKLHNFTIDCSIEDDIVDS